MLGDPEEGRGKAQARVAVQATRVTSGKLSAMDIFMAPLAALFLSQVAREGRIGVLVVESEMGRVALVARHTRVGRIQAEAGEGVDPGRRQPAPLAPAGFPGLMATLAIVAQGGPVGRSVALGARGAARRPEGQPCAGVGAGRRG